MVHRLTEFNGTIMLVADARLCLAEFHLDDVDVRDVITSHALHLRPYE